VIYQASALSRFFRCGHFYKLVTVENVPSYPTTRQLLGRIVRDGVQRDLSVRRERGELLPTDEARTALHADAQRHFGQVIAWTDAQVKQGQRTAFEATFAAALRLYMPWRAIIARDIEPTGVAQEFTLAVGDDSVVGSVEIVERNAVRGTRVRSRAPEAHEPGRDFGMLIEAVALEKSVIHLDYLIDSKPIVVLKQACEVTPEMQAATIERLRAAIHAVRAGQFLPAELSVWHCQSCQLRPACAYV
jgi:hypothetical protein